MNQVAERTRSPLVWSVCAVLLAFATADTVEAKKDKAKKQEKKAAKLHSNVKSVKARDITHEQLLGMVDDYNAAVTAERQGMEDAAMRRTAREYEAHMATGAPFVRDMMVISGGGAKGAFGAGFFEGWQTVTGELALPEFDVVTGVSTGALIAPFAFIGTAESYMSIAEFYANPEANWAHKRGMLALAPSHVSLFNDDLLQEKIRTSIDPAMVQAMADAAAEDRVLQIGTTNLDFGVGRIFNMSQEAIDAAKSGSADRVHSTLLASSAIPGVFPPVMIDGLFYGDGGAAANLAVFMSDSFNDRWRSEYPDAPLPKYRIWIVINQQLRIEPTVTKAKWISVAGRGLGTATHSLQLFAMHLLHHIAIELRVVEGLDVEFRWVAIPADAPKKGTKSMFDKEHMRALEDLGRAMGADPSSWNTKVPDIYSLAD